MLIDAGEEGLLNGAADVAYFGYRPAKEGITWIPAGHNVTFLMASRGYLRRHGSPQSVEELRNHTLLLRYTSNRSFSRRLENRDASFEIESDDKVHFEDAYSCRTHLIAGEGISVDLVPSFVADELMRGQLDVLVSIFCDSTGFSCFAESRLEFVAEHEVGGSEHAQRGP